MPFASWRMLMGARIMTYSVAVKITRSTVDNVVFTCFLYMLWRKNLYSVIRQVMKVIVRCENRSLVL